MKDKYDNIDLKDIDPNTLFSDIRNELNTSLIHIDMLKAITSSNCVTLTLLGAFREIGKAFAMITAIDDSGLIKLTNRFQEGD